MSSCQRCRVAIIGAGPGGLFCANELASHDFGDVIMLERGRPLRKRFCPETSLCACKPCDVLEGEGGAGGFSDGKITLVPRRGVQLPGLFLGERRQLIQHVDRVLRAHGARGAVFGRSEPKEDIRGASLKLDAYEVRHVGTDGIRRAFASMVAALRDQGVQLITSAHVTDVTRGEEGTFQLRVLKEREEEIIIAGAVVVASGLSGTEWAERQLTQLGVVTQEGPADLGIRVETRREALQCLTDSFYDFKLTLPHHAGITYRSFCVNPGGLLITEYYSDLGLRSVNGHAYSDAKSPYTNFAVLATISTSYEPNPKAFVKRAIQHINAVGRGYPVVQQMGDFLSNRAPGGSSLLEWALRPSTNKLAVGRLSAALPGAVYGGIVDYLTSLGRHAPQVLDPVNVVCGPEFKYLQARVQVDPATMQTSIPGLYVVGNATGYTASMMGAAAAGVIAGRSLMGKST